MCSKVKHYTHPKHAAQIFIDASKEGWGAHLNERTARGNLVPSRKQATHKLPGTKGGLVGPKGVPRPMPEQNSIHSYRQHLSCCLHKPLCALLWRILTWCARKPFSLKVRHIPGQLNMVADKLSRLGKTIESGLYL